MERDDNQPPAWHEARRQRVGQRPLQMYQFVIDGNPQRLEDTCCRVPSPPTPPHGFGHRFGQVSARPDRRRLPTSNQFARNPATLRLVPPTPQALFQLPFLDGCQPFPGRVALRRIKTQVQRAIVFKAEPATIVSELIRREPEVEQHGIDRTGWLIGLGKDRREIRVAALVKRAPGMIKNRRSHLEHRLITIQAQQPTFLTQFDEDS